MSDFRKVEEILGEFSARPAPEELRSKVLDAVRRKQRRQILTPAWRWTLGSCLMATTILTVVDFGLSVRERHHLSTFLDRPGMTSVSRAKSVDEKTQEILACLPDLDADSRRELQRALRRNEAEAAPNRRSVRLGQEEIHEY